MAPANSLPLTLDHNRVGLQEYVHRIVHFREQCDFEYTFCTMLWLCIDPRRVYRNAEYSSRTKHQWARDDPGFVVVMVALIASSMTAWSIALGPASISMWLANVAYEVLVDFLGLGLVAAGVAWCARAIRAARCHAPPIAHGVHSMAPAPAMVSRASASAKSSSPKRSRTHSGI